MEYFNYMLFDAFYEEIAWWAMVLRGLIVYVIAIIMFKIGGKRMFSNYGSFDIVISIFLGAMLAKAIVGNAKFIPTIITILVLVMVHRLFAMITESNRPTGKIIKGVPVLLFKNGQFFEKEMTHRNLTEEDVMEAMRIEAKINEFSKVKEIYLERNGRISIIPL